MVSRINLVSRISLGQAVNQYAMKRRGLKDDGEASENNSEVRKYIRKGKYIYEVDGNGKVIQIVGEIKKNQYGKERFVAVFGKLKFDDLDKKDRGCIRTIKKETNTCKKYIKEIQKKSMMKTENQFINKKFKIERENIIDEYDKHLICFGQEGETTFKDNIEQNLKSRKSEDDPISEANIDGK
ncbi:hypothetical protein [Crassaminicella profunda]|uniref:hypothetical protein n=1 Tax=Crassaminicella profunda TaxID=1286698 RepID=UPI001CA7055D|nr:hypothetical protein [Crassaminicella profunda]QZY55740.1 hypothetical protein K7H06_01610 [Crassaminicella profunda]